MPDRLGRGRARRIVAGLLAAGAAVALVVPAGAPLAGGQEPPPVPVQVEMTPVDSLVDGDKVTVTVRTDPSFPVYEIQARLCRAGVDYQPGVVQPAEDFRSGGLNCPSKPVSSSATLSVTLGDTRGATKPAGVAFDYLVGTGTVTWSETGSAERSLTCDADNPCALVVQVYAGPTGQLPTYLPFVQTLDFGGVDPIAGCGGPAPGILTTGGSDRITDAWVAWTLARCADSGGGAPTRAVLAGEGEAVAAFAAGHSDLAYTGLGYHPEAGLVPDPATARQAVQVPIGVNAVVVAVAGGRRLTEDTETMVSGTKVPYEHLQLTNEELARLLSGGKAGIDPWILGILDANPELRTGGMFDPEVPEPVLAAAERGTVAWMATDYLATLETEAFRVPNLSLFQDFIGQDRPANSSFALSTPPYLNAVRLFSGRPVLRRELALVNRASSGGLWILTDLATARAFGLTVVDIQNADGEAVSPTPASMLAAVDQLLASGDPLADPHMVGADGTVDPYPLTFVEYAMAPAEPLLADDCSARTDSQALLADWLGFVTGPGQANLPEGVEPLTPALQAMADEARGQVGAAPVTGACAGTVTPPPPVAPMVAPPGSSSFGGADRRFGSRPSSSAAPGTTDAAAPGGSDGPVDDVSAAIPAFAGRDDDGGTTTLIGLAAALALASIATVSTSAFAPAPSGRPPGGRRRR